MSAILSRSFFVLLALTPSLAAQRVGGGLDKIYSWYGESMGDIYGQAIAGLDDLDGDGVGELAVGGPGYELGAIANAGRLTIYSGANGLPLYEYIGSHGVHYENLGVAVTALDDVDQDGVGDFAFSATGIGEGEVYVHSGASGARLRSFTAPAGVEDFGAELAGCPDLDQDGMPELVIGASYSDSAGFTNNGIVLILSADSGQELRRHTGSATNVYLGQRVAVLDDIDGDNLPEILSGAPSETANSLFQCGVAYVWSGASGAELYRIVGDKPSQQFGFSVTSAGDVNADGVVDFAIGAPADRLSTGNWEGSMRVHSGADGSELWRFRGTASSEQLGYATAAFGDFNRDGFDDVLAGAPGNAFGGRAYLLSGQDGSLLHRMDSEDYTDEFGCRLAAVGDIDLDGELDLLVGACRADGPGVYHGGGYLYSFAPYLTASAHSISASAGGMIRYSIDFPPEYLNGYRYAVILVSASGPGRTHVQGWPVPLAADAVFQATLSGMHPPQLLGGITPLDNQGNSTATVLFAPGEASALIGRSFWLCAVKYEDSPWMQPLVYGVSVAESFQITP